MTPFRAVILVTVSWSFVASAATTDAGVPTPEAKVARPQTKFKWDVPGVVSNVEMPGITWAMGVPVKMHAVTAKGKIDDIMRYMYDSFVKQGLFVDHRLQMGPMLTGVDPDTLITYSAVFQEGAPGFVTVVLGEANIRLSQPPRGKDFIPLFPGAYGVLRSSVEGIDTLVYYAPVKTEEKVREFYRDVLPKAGYRVDPQDPATYIKGEEQVSLQVKLKEGTVSVFATRRGRAPGQ